MAADDVAEVVAVDAEIDALTDPTSSQVWRNTFGYSADAVAAAAIRRALEGVAGPQGDPNPIEAQIKVCDDETVATAGNGKFVFHVSAALDGLELTGAVAYVTTVSFSGPVEVQIRNATQAADMLTTPITIDESEFNSLTSAAPRVIDAANDDVAEGDQIAVDVDEAGSEAKGLGVVLTFS